MQGHSNAYSAPFKENLVMTSSYLGPTVFLGPSTGYICQVARIYIACSVEIQGFPAKQISTPITDNTCAENYSFLLIRI
jgi:hypothetical protein